MKCDDMRNDFARTFKKFECSQEVSVTKTIKNAHFYHTITHPKAIPEREFIATLKEEITSFLANKKVSPRAHIFVIGIGNDSHTADSIGPKVLKHIHVNSHLEEMGLPIKGYKISSLEPGVLGETGIETTRIIECIKDEIKPDAIVLIDAFVTDDSDIIEHAVFLSDEGLIPGSGIKGNNRELNEINLSVPVLTIGVPTALEVFLSGKSEPKEKKVPFLLAPADIDSYVDKVSSLIGRAIDEALLPFDETDTPVIMF